MPQDETKDARAGRLHNESEPAAPLWTRIPRGWTILGLFALAWVGVYLIWNGIRVVFHI